MGFLLVLGFWVFLLVLCHRYAVKKQLKADNYSGGAVVLTVVLVALFVLQGYLDTDDRERRFLRVVAGPSVFQSTSAMPEPEPFRSTTEALCLLALAGPVMTLMLIAATRPGETKT